jgi:hypothetical protein
VVVLMVLRRRDLEPAAKGHHQPPVQPDIAK